VRKGYAGYYNNPKMKRKRTRVKRVKGKGKEGEVRIVMDIGKDI
jgi:hypothetical protein